MVGTSKGVPVERIIKYWQNVHPNSEMTSSLVPKLRQYAMTKFVNSGADTVVIKNGEQVVTKGLNKKIITNGDVRYERTLQNFGDCLEQPWSISCIIPGAHNGYVADVYNGIVTKIQKLNELLPTTNKEYIFDELGHYVQRDNKPFIKLQERIQKLFDKKCEQAVKEIKIPANEYSRLVKQTKLELSDVPIDELGGHLG